LGLAEFMILGKGMGTDMALPPSLLADVWESLLAAIYLDSGFETAKAFAIEHVAPEIAKAADGGTNENYKSLLQQVAQRQYGAAPHYHLLGERGPDHKKAFKIAAQIAGKRFAAAWGRNKKEAEQRAASNALCALRGEPPPFACEEDN
jgi:ribonuclease-3